MLKAQDVLVLLKICSYGFKPSYESIARDVGISQSEAHSAVKRLKKAKLLHGVEMGERPNITTTEEFLIHGLKYLFPAEHSSFVRGMPTSYAAEPLNKLIKQGDDPIPVWPHPEGEARGIGLIPLYKSVPEAASRDPLLYKRLALIDAIRDGRARERKLAESELINSLEQNHGPS